MVMATKAVTIFNKTMTKMKAGQWLATKLMVTKTIAAMNNKDK